MRAVLERVGLARQADLPCRYLCAGQKRRLALARLLVVASAPLWLLDEPFAALDTAGQALVARADGAAIAARAASSSPPRMIRWAWAMKA